MEPIHSDAVLDDRLGLTKDETNLRHGKILTGWAAVDKRVRDSDESKVEDFKEDVDTLLVFAGLFSAVTTALLLDSYKFLQEDRVETSNILLAQVYLHLVNASIAPPPLERIACVATSTCNFTPSSTAKHINYLWFSSLILSLVTASFGILVKQWLREYLSGNFALGRSHLRLRFFRYMGMVKWRVFKIASLLPLLLQLALGLFFAGLCIFSQQINPTLGSLTTTLVTTWAFLFILILCAPAFSPRCPYKVTFLKEFMQYVRVILNHYLLVDYGLPARHSSLYADSLPQQNSSASPYEEESFAVNQASVSEDLDILLAIDCELLDDGLLATGIADLLVQITSQQGMDLIQVQNSAEQLLIPWVLRIIENRVQNKRGTRFDLSTRIALNGQLSIKAWNAIVNIVSHAIIHSLQRYDKKSMSKTWIAEAVTILLSNSGYPLPVEGQRALSECLREDAARFSDIICTRTYAPLFSFTVNNTTPPIGKDAFHMLLETGIGDVLRHLQGEDFLSVIHVLISSRYRCSSSKACSHQTLSQLLAQHVFTSTFPRLRLDTNGGFCIILDMIIDKLEHIFQSSPSSSMPLWVLRAISVVFTYRSCWSETQLRRIINWTAQRQTLVWHLQLANPIIEGRDIIREVSTMVTAVTKEFFMGTIGESSALIDRKSMLQYVSDILRADCEATVVDDLNMLRINHLGLGELLLDLLQWQLRATPDPNQSKHHALMNAWKIAIRNLAQVIQATSNSSVYQEQSSIRRLLDLARSLDIPANMDNALNELLLALEARYVDSERTSEKVVVRRGDVRVRRPSVSSGTGLLEVLSSTRRGSFVSIIGGADGQSPTVLNGVANDNENHAMASSPDGVNGAS